MSVRATAGVLVTDAGDRSVLAAIRTLHAGGYKVGAAAHARPAAGQWSRACARAYHVPDPRVDGAAFVAEIERVVARGDYAALLVGSDFSLLAVSEHRARLRPFVKIGLPDHEVVLGALSKSKLGRVAAEVGLQTPTSIACHGEQQVLAAARELGFPVVAKSAAAVVAIGRGAQRPDSRLLADEASLRQWCAQQPAIALLQRRETGDVHSFAGVATADGLLGIAFARYRRTWPAEAGNASFAETLTAPRDLREQVAALIELMGWRGVFELELIRRADGSYLAIDLNPRVYGSLTLAAHAGASLATLWCDALLGRAVDPQIARAGVCYRWEEGELRNFAARLRDGSLGAAIEIARPRRGCVHADFALNDPAPLAARALLGARRVVQRRRRRHDGPKSGAVVHAKIPALATSSPSLPTAIIGAGPYGLSIGAHLRDAGVPVVQFGRTMSYWREQMPAGMLLRSSQKASSISDPHRALRIEHWAREVGHPLARPIEIAEFIEYGEWFQRKTAPDLDERLVANVQNGGAGFQITLEDGETVHAGRVIVAAGLFPFARRPAPLDELPTDDVSHASEHADLIPFAGKRVAVIGSGQSALESAALLREHGADVQVIARNPTIYWLGFNPEGDVPPPTVHWPKPPTDVGGRVTGWIAATPESFRIIRSRRLRETVMFRCVRPAGAGWLADRLADVPISLGRIVTSAEHGEDGVRLTLDDATTRVVDHVFLGTGYQVDVRRYPFLSPELTGALELDEGLPLLAGGLESSVPGLHFVGAPATRSFGPIMRFVVGTWFAAPAVTRRVTGRRLAPLALSY